MNSIVGYLGVIGGSGKSSISGLLSDVYGDTTVINVSKQLLAFSGLNSYNEFDLVSDSKDLEIRKRLYDSKLSEVKTKFALVDSHYIKIKPQQSLKPIVDLELASRFDIFFHIIAPPEIILQRILADEYNRERRLSQYAKISSDITAAISRCQDESVMIARKLASQLRKPFKVMPNYAPKNEIAYTLHEELKALARKDVVLQRVR